MFYSSIYDLNFSEYFHSTNVVKIIFLARAVSVKTGFVIKAPNYEIEDPIFRHWIRRRVDLRI
jgi:uncharacterized ubiquitin-like protein YukD